ncbi:hypothetical protein GQ53DRAFT_592436, partial [Thozetella sp. PMI_491]
RDSREHPRAFVVRTLKSPATVDALDQLVRSQFARQKWLAGGIYFIDSLPRTGSGKVMKRTL